MSAPLAAPRWAEPRRPGREGGARLGGAIWASALAHGAVIAAAIFWRGPAPAPAPPVYAVSLVAAPPGPRAIGVVEPEPPRAAPQAAPVEEVTPPTPSRAESRPEAMKAPATTKVPPKTPPRATPVPATAKKPTPPKPTPARPAAKPPATKAPPTPAAKPNATGSTAPRAGGGPEGGRGTDVANVQIAGLQFPYRGYLDNIVRQVALRFSPPTKSSPLQADVAFLIHRDGTVSDVRIVKKSGNFSFDIEARGAVESAGQARAFGPLPDGFREDVLPVTFSFDPRIIR